MFAYCLNDPVNRTDLTGSVGLWYYLIIDSDMGFIHRAVVDHIASQNPGVSIEYTLSSFGRADVFDFGIGAIWEVKHAGTDPGMRTAAAQLQAYGYWLLNEEVNCFGKANAFSGIFYIQCLNSSYKVEYYTPVAGAVLYTVTEVGDYDGEFFRVYVPKSVDEKQKKNAFSSAPVYATLAIAAACAGAMFLAHYLCDAGLTPHRILRTA